MAGAPNSQREDRIKALRIMADTVISRTDDEEGNRDWKGRSEVLAAIALLASVERSAGEEQRSDAAPFSSCPEDTVGEVEISPTIPWVAEEGHSTDTMTIVERGRLFSAWSEKQRRQREG